MKIGKIHVSVTQSDIDQGVRFHCDGCPIALAIRRVVPAKTYVTVGYGTAHIGLLAYRMPDIAHQFAREFDFHRRVRPIEFDLTLITGGDVMTKQQKIDRSFQVVEPNGAIRYGTILGRPSEGYKPKHPELVRRGAVKTGKGIARMSPKKLGEYLKNMFAVGQNNRLVDRVELGIR